MYSCNANLRGGKISAEFKLYFLGNAFLGDGFGAFSCNIRLLTVLRHLPADVGYRLRLSEDADEGVMIFENGFVMKFRLGGNKKNYYISTLEGPFKSSDEKLRKFGLRYAESLYKEYNVSDDFSSPRVNLAFKKLKIKLKIS
jgi:hypothetical protein